MDLAELKTLDTAEVEIRHPTTGAKTGIRISIASADSERAKSFDRAARNERLRKMQRNRRSEITAEELEETDLEFLAHCTVGWSGVLDEGKTVECTPANAMALFKKYPWLREQVDEAVADRRNFLPKPAKS